MDRRVLLFALILMHAAFSPHTLCAESSVATPAIDPSIFKDGAVRAKNFQFDAWYARCEEIIKIKKRVCNLLSSLKSSAGIDSGSVIIATTDSGIPAFMIAPQTVMGLDSVVTIETSHLSKVEGRIVKVEYKQSGKPMVCDPGCKYMLPLDSRLVFSLNAGEDVKVAFAKASTPTASKQSALVNPLSGTVLTISGQGFSKTLQATTQDW